MTPPLWLRCVLFPLWLVRAVLMAVVLPALVVVIVVAAFLAWDAAWAAASAAAWDAQNTELERRLLALLEVE